MNWITEERIPENNRDVLIIFKPVDSDTSHTALAWMSLDEFWRNSVSTIKLDEADIIVWPPQRYSDTEHSLSSKIRDIIESEVDIEEVPFGNGDFHKSQKSIDAAVTAIINCIANH